MAFFNKKKDHSNYDDYYDENGFFVGDNNWKTQNYSGHDNQANYSGYENHAFDKVEDEGEKQSVSVILMTLMFAYLFFLVFGMFSTTFEKGYIPQIINVEIRSQRVIHDRLLPVIEYVYEVDTFRGMPELTGLVSKENVSSRIVQLKLISNEIENSEKEIEKIVMRIKDKDPIKLELAEITKSILSSTKQLNTGAISYYETITGYSNIEDPAVIKLQNEILTYYNVHQNKLLDAKGRLNQIRSEVLLID